MSATAVDEAVDRLRSFGCHELLLALIDGLPADSYIVVKVNQGSSVFVPVAAGADCVAAIYAEKKVFYVALEPDRAQHFAGLTDAPLNKDNATTWRIAIEPSNASGASKRLLVQAIDEALVRSAQKPAAEKRDANQKAPSILERSCTVCHIALPATGVCDDHGK